MVRALRELPGWSRTSAIEHANFAAQRRASLEPRSPPRIAIRRASLRVTKDSKEH
jgi:hypothetical protein